MVRKRPIHIEKNYGDQFIIAPGIHESVHEPYIKRFIADNKLKDVKFIYVLSSDETGIVSVFKINSTFKTQ